MSQSRTSEYENIMYNAWKRYIKEDKSVIDDIYDIIFPFCLRVCSRTCGRYITTSDEEASIARLALIEAFDRYNPERGSFLMYLGQVIKTRIIDYKRREKRHFNLQLIYSKRKQPYPTDMVDENFIDDVVDGLARQQEIEKFKEVLQGFKIEFQELVVSGPQQQKTRERAREIAWCTANNKKTAEYLLEKKKLPIKMLEELFGANRKIIDRYRKFIIASAIIILYDFQYLKSYVIPDKGRDVHG